MKIGILTHPLAFNYGGILQCYALFTCLKKMGHDPIVINRVIDDNRSFLRKCIGKMARFLHVSNIFHSVSVDRAKNIRPFVDKYIYLTNTIDSQKKMNSVCSQYDLDAVVVGSDQVWRSDYAMRYGYNYFLDFVPSHVTKISYAASFGLSEWTYTDEQTNRIQQLLNEFNAVSVRESDGVELLRRNIGISSVQLADPTMLLCKEDYLSITNDRIVANPYVFVYWLGDHSEIYDVVQTYKKNGYHVIEIYLRDNVEQISVQDWLSYICYANIVITDSFHGLVFSMIFERQFIIYPNESGGIGRIKSLLDVMGISPDKPKFEMIRFKLNEFRKDSIDFLKTSIQ